MDDDIHLATCRYMFNGVPKESRRAMDFHMMVIHEALSQQTRGQFGSSWRSWESGATGSFRFVIEPKNAIS